jgi:hypothetical protein
MIRRTSSASGGKACQGTPMRSLKQNTTTTRRSPYNCGAIRKFSLSCAITALLVFSGFVSAFAQTTTTASNTLLATGFTLPYGAQVLNGSAVNPATGKSFRHLWSGDTGGLCRLDPDLDTGAPLTVNIATCITTVAGVAFSPGRMTYDPLNNTIYAVDDANPANVARFHFLPNGDSGQGLVSATAVLRTDRKAILEVLRRDQHFFKFLYRLSSRATCACKRI